MNTLLLDPTDVLFFRDGRPMGGASSGHGAAWPLPTVVNHAFHAALHRAGETFDKAHAHRRGRSGNYIETRDRKFGSLVTAGPFPVCTNGEAHTWFFPRPLDAGTPDSTNVTYRPLEKTLGESSLPGPAKYPVLNTEEASKDPPKPWWSEGAWSAYLGSTPRDNLAARPFFKADADFADTEFSYGIGIDPDSGTQDGESFYSAHYLRLRDGWRLGCFARGIDKEHPTHGGDLIKTLLNGRGAEIIAGGQQRICTARFAPDIQDGPLPLPVGATIQGNRVKWVLLTPAIFPEIGDHPGGWLPNWVDQTTGEVRLLDGPGKNYAKRHNVPEGKAIDARLVAAITGKPVPVTGYALPNSADPERGQGGAKSTHLAVPAGSVYYFESDAAQALATALNWHGAGDGTTIHNRRSTLMGEKGFGLGVCGTWAPHTGKVPGHPRT